MVVKENPNRSLFIAAGIVAASLFLVRCGYSDKQATSSLKDGYVPANVTTEVFPDQGISYIYDRDYNFVTDDELGNIAKTALSEKLRSMGIIPTDLPEYFHMNLTLSNLRGCSVYDYYAYCSRNFNLHVILTVNGGPDLIDSYGMDAYLESIDRHDLRRGLKWSIDQIVDHLVEGGLLEAMGIDTETPYF